MLLYLLLLLTNSLLKDCSSTSTGSSLRISCIVVDATTSLAADSAFYHHRHFHHPRFAGHYIHLLHPTSRCSIWNISSRVCPFQDLLKFLLLYSMDSQLISELFDY